MDLQTIDVNQIIAVLSDKQTMVELYGACAILTLLLMAINWKKKRFLIYWAIVCLPVGAILFNMENIAQIVAESLAGSYSSVVSLVSGTLFSTTRNIGLGLMIAAAVFIVLFIISSVVESKKE